MVDERHSWQTYLDILSRENHPRFASGSVQLARAPKRRLLLCFSRLRTLLLHFHIALDHRECYASCRADEVRIGPEPRHSLFECWILLPKQKRRPAFDELDERAYAKLRIDIDQHMHVIWPDFQS